MRILHTSDWHLGQHFMGKTRQAEHEALIDWLLAQVALHAVDAVVVAGDVFDTGAPPSYARELYNRLVLALCRQGVALYILAGNHDSVATLEESRSLLAQLGATVVAAAGGDASTQVVLMHDKHGEPAAIFCAIPFIRPRDVLHSHAGQSASEKQASLQQAIAAHYRQLFEMACELRDKMGLPLPIVASGHLTTVGARSSESVREIYVGTLEALPAQAFPLADYIALGHIHRPQQVGGQPHIRYCGSPIPLSFDEAGQQKEMLLVELSAEGLQQVTALAVPCFQPLSSVSGDLPQLAEAIRTVATLGSWERPVWLEVMVEGDDYLSDLQNRVQALCDGLPVDVLRLRRARSHFTAGLQRQTNETLDELDPDEVFARRLQAESLDDDLCAGLQQRYAEVVRELMEGKQ